MLSTLAPIQARTIRFCPQLSMPSSRLHVLFSINYVNFSSMKSCQPQSNETLPVQDLCNESHGLHYHVPPTHNMLKHWVYHETCPISYYKYLINQNTCQHRTNHFYHHSINGNHNFLHG